MINTTELSKIPFCELLHNHEILKFHEDHKVKRKRIFTPEVTLAALMNQISSLRGSCQDAVFHVFKYLLDTGKKVCSLGTSAYVKARNRVSLKSLKKLNETIYRSMHPNREWLWNDRKVVIMDGSTITMADSEKNQKKFPMHSNQTEGCGYPLARIVTVTSLESGAIKDLEIGPYSGKNSGELSLGSKALKRIDSHSVVLVDAIYLSYRFSITSKNEHLDFICPVKSRKMNIIDRKDIGPDDYLIVVKKPRRSRLNTFSKEEHAKWPGHILLRETHIKVQKPGGKTVDLKLISSFTDVSKVTKEDIAKLASARWNIELDIKILKKELGIEFVPCKTPGLVMKYIWTAIILHNLIRRLMCTAAEAFGKLPRDISYRNTLNFYLQFAGRFWSEHHRSNLLESISSFAVGKQRGRIEPRAVKTAQQANAFPKLSINRNRWKLIQVLGEVLEIGFDKDLRELLLNLPSHIPKTAKGEYKY